MTSAEYRQALDALPYGKRLPGAVYLIDPGDDPSIPPLLRITVAELRKRLGIGTAFNLLKFHTASPKISFLSYPDFEKDPHPALADAVIVDLVTGKSRRDDYRSRANPPILHRKETFIPPDHPLHGKFAKLTKQEEAAGLLDDTSRIGFRLNWERALSERGLCFKGHRLVETGDKPLQAATSPKKKIQRHKTALVRREISKPVKTLLELGQIRRNESFFDYGCGYGGDVEAIGKCSSSSRNASSPRITRSGRRWHASARNSANSASARKPSATGRRRKSGSDGIAICGDNHRNPGLDRIRLWITMSA